MTTASPAPPSSESPVRIALVGVNWGERVLQQLLGDRCRPLFDVVGVAARRPERASALAERYGLVAYESLDEVLDEPGVEAVALMVGPDVRYELAARCLRRGKHVMTTKPLDLDSDRALSILQEAQGLGLAMHLNSPHPVLAPDLAQIRAWIDEHDLGRMISVRGEQWVSYHERPDGTWYDDPQSLPVAPIGRLGIYVLNDLVQLFGSPSRVCVAHSRIRTGRPTPDNAIAVFEYADGALGSLFTSLCVDDGEQYRCAMTINFERGTVYRNVGPSDPAPSRDLVRLELAWTDRSGLRHRDEVLVPGGSGTYHWDAFHKAIRHPEGLGSEALSPEQIVEPLRTLAALGVSERDGGWVAVAPLNPRRR